MCYVVLLCEHVPEHVVGVGNCCEISGLVGFCWVACVVLGLCLLLVGRCWDVIVRQCLWLLVCVVVCLGVFVAGNHTHRLVEIPPANKS